MIVANEKANENTLYNEHLVNMYWTNVYNYIISNIEHNAIK